MKNTAIEWAHHTCNFFVGCTKVSPGCKHCYMYRLEKRWGRDPSKVRKTDWKARVRELKSYEPSNIFVNSMSDTFHKDVTDEEIEQMLAIMVENSKHTYIVLTKRIERAVEFFKTHVVPDNVWLGTSVESEWYLFRINYLRQINAKTRFVSFEPLISFIDLGSADLEGIHWVIVGGESDQHEPTPMLPLWVATIFNVCKQRGIAFFFKQWGGKTKCACHKSWGCRIFEGQTWDEMPKVIV